MYNVATYKNSPGTAMCHSTRIDFSKSDTEYIGPGAY
jgi:hypothetical protein